MDHLVGLKENVIIGKLIPAGTGLDMYRDPETVIEAPAPAPEEPEEEVDLSALLNSGNAL